MVAAGGTGESAYADAAVGGDRVSGDGTALLAGGEQDVGRGEVARVGAGVVQRDGRGRTSPGEGGRDRAVAERQRLGAAQVGVHAAAGDAVHPDLGGQLVGELAHETQAGVLAGGVEGPAAVDVAGGVGQRHDDAAARPDQLGPGGLGGQQVALDVDREDLVEGGVDLLAGQAGELALVVPHAGV